MEHVEFGIDNRDRKVAGRTKRARYVQGTRSFTHAMTNRIAKEATSARRRRAKKPRSVR